MPTDGENSRDAGLGDRELILERLLAENNLVLELGRAKGTLARAVVAFRAATCPSEDSAPACDA